MLKRFQKKRNTYKCHKIDDDSVKIDLLDYIRLCADKIRQITAVI